MTIRKGDRFKDYVGNLCFISYIKGAIVKLTFIDTPSYTEVWDRAEFIDEINSNRFFPQPKIVVNRTNITEHLLEYQLNMIGKTIEEAKKWDDWYTKWTMTSKQHELFKAYAIPLLKKIFKCRKERAEGTFAWFDLGWGLRIKD